MLDRREQQKKILEVRVRKRTDHPEGAEHPELISFSELASNYLRPRAIARRGTSHDAHFRNIFRRLEELHDKLFLLGQKGEIDIAPPAASSDLVVSLNDLFRRIYGVEAPVSRKSVRTNFYVVNNEKLQHLLQNRVAYFGRLYGEPKKAVSSPKGLHTPEFTHLHHQLQRTWFYLQGKREEDPDTLLRDLFRAYMDYAAKLRSLPKPS